MVNLVFILLIVFFSCGAITSLLMLLEPKLAIEKQKKFCEKRNWKIEPISSENEIRNTRLLGVTLLIFLIITIIYVINNPIFL